jgi:hypothetical protein
MGLSTDFDKPTSCFQSYDLPLMAATLISTLQSRGLGQVRLQRDGTKILYLRVRNLAFREVRRLLPAGTSLESFRRTMGLEENRKMSFPFDKLESDLTFLDQPELPPLASDWASRLTGEAPTQETVDAAREICRAEGLNVRGFLAKYLKEDVWMLARGLDVLRKSYFALLQIDFVVVDKVRIDVG